MTWFSVDSAYMYSTSSNGSVPLKNSSCATNVADNYTEPTPLCSSSSPSSNEPNQNNSVASLWAELDYLVMPFILQLACPVKYANYVNNDTTEWHLDWCIHQWENIALTCWIYQQWIMNIHIASEYTYIDKTCFISFGFYSRLYYAKS